LYSVPNDIMLDTETNELTFNARGDLMTAADLVGEDNKINASVKQWVRNRILLDYLNGHPELESLNNYVSELNTDNLEVSTLSTINKYIETALLENEFIESVSVSTSQDKEDLSLILNIDYVVYASASTDSLQAIWEV